MKKIVTFILLSLFTTFAFAQNTVTGSVKDAVTGEPLIGVGVIVSTGGGTVTDVDGSFSVNAGKDATLTFNLLGYADVTEPVNGRNKMDVFMKEDINFLDEVVVMGYTTQKKNELSSSVVSLRSEELLDNSTPDLGNMIQGKAVESVTILKDASATALYGASAAGGVIVVTTKSAKDRGRTDVNFKASAGIKQSLSGRYRPMNSQELYETQRMMMSAKNFEAQRPESLLGQDFDWYGNIFKKGIVQD